MGDHAPASEARTRCGRKFWDIRYANKEKQKQKQREMNVHAPVSEARTRRDRNGWDVKFVYIEI